MNIEKTRIYKLREYLLTILDDIRKDKKSSINANMLSNNVDNYSLDKIPVQTNSEKWITGQIIRKEVYSFRSRVAYSIETITNLENVGFYEVFESKISSNNKEGILPTIENIQEIECLNCGSLVDALSTSVLEVNGKQLVKVVAWYDNEMGYSTQMVRTAKYLMQK